MAYFMETCLSLILKKKKKKVFLTPSTSAHHRLNSLNQRVYIVIKSQHISVWLFKVRYWKQNSAPASQRVYLKPVSH